MMNPLFESTQFGGAVLDVLDTGIIILGDDYRIRIWNAWMERATGAKQAAVAGQSIWDVLPALVDSRLRDAVDDALEAGASRSGSRQKGSPNQDARSPRPQELDSESALAAALRRALDK